MSEERSLTKVGRVYMGFGDYGKAVKVLYRAVLESPDDVDTRLDLAEALSETGRFEEAKKQWRSIIELDENNSAVYYNLGCYYKEIAGDPDQAIAMFSKAVENDPTYAKAHFYLAQLSNNLDRIIEGVQEALRHNSHLEDAPEWLEEAQEMKTAAVPSARREEGGLAKMRLLAAFMLKADRKFGAALTQLKLAREVCQEEKMLSVIDQLEREVKDLKRGQS